MAQDPLRPKDSGKVKLPKVDAGHNRIAPQSLTTKKDSKGGKKDPASIMLGAEDGKAESGKKRPSAEDMKLLDEARKNFERALNSESDNRRAMLDDLKFKTGDQWPTEVAIARNQEKRPCLTINKTRTFCHQVTNDLRQNRPAIHVNPIGDRGDPEAAKSYRGLIKSIERDSRADLAYDTAANHMVSMGKGFVQVVTEYEPGASFNQNVRIKRVRNPFTVYLDPDHQEPDFSDGKWAFVSEMMTRDAFNAEYPGADPMSWTQAGVGETLKNWIEKDSVRIALYYKVKVENRKLVHLDNGHTGWEDELDDGVKEKIASGEMKVVTDREAEVRSVKCYKMTAVEILESYDWPGTTIPLVPMIGDEEDIEGKVKLSGIVRDMKDAQRMYNFWRTLQTEIIALQPKAPFVMVEGQEEGHETEWKQANTKNLPYLTYKPVDIAGHPAPAPQRQPPLGTPAGVDTAIAGAAQDMQATSGIRFDATMNERMEDESGKAIRELRRSGDLTTYHYADNMGHALRRVGSILIEVIPEVYDTKRVLTILREDDTEDRIHIDPSISVPYMERPAPPPTQQEPKPKTLKIFNPKVGQYGVTVTIGPSYATKRIEASENMVAFAKAVPQVAGLIADLIAKNQDWPGAEEIAKRLAKAVPPQLMTVDQKDIPPQVAAMLQALQNHIKMMMMERQKLIVALTEKASDRQLAKSKIDKDYEAKIIKVIADLEKAQLQAQSGGIETLADAVNELKEALEESENQEDPIEVAMRHNAEMTVQLQQLAATIGSKPKKVKTKTGPNGIEINADWTEEKPKAHPKK